MKELILVKKFKSRQRFEGVFVEREKNQKVITVSGISNKSENVMVVGI